MRETGEIMAEVLLVDDDSSVLITLAIALRRHGHQVTVAGDAKQALHHLDQHRFEFLISDVRMPGMSGIELARRVQRMHDAPRIVLTSAYFNLESRIGTSVMFLQKPLDVSQLNAVLHNATGSTAERADRLGHGSLGDETNLSTSQTR